MRLETRGAYTPDWPEIAYQTRKAADWRCVRCGHRFIPKRDGNLAGLPCNGGEWSPCDERCTHKGLVRVWVEVEGVEGEGHWWETVCEMPVNQLVPYNRIEASWRILTVHHLDGNKGNNRWWNLLPLCQVCHLYIQGRVIPTRPWLFEHSDWAKVYIAGFYAAYYAKCEITRAEAEADLDRWLAIGQPWLYGRV